MKRLADVVIACVLLLLALPLMLLVAAAIKSETPGPVLERRSRIGRGGVPFQMLKFRTTVHDPKGTAPAWARKTTQVGQLLQHTRIDSLPQLLNVLRGEMSLTDPEGPSPTFLD